MGPARQVGHAEPQVRAADTDRRRPQGPQLAVVALQRLAGNRAVASMLAGPGRGRPPAVQRQPFLTVPTEGRPLGPGDQGEKEQEFRDAGGEKLVGELRSALAGWRAFRSSPRSGDPGTMPGLAAAAAALSAFGPVVGGVQYLDGWPKPWMREYASAQLGHEALIHLGEMASLDTGFPGKVSNLFRVAKRTVSHQYQLSMTATTDLTDKAAGSLVPLVTITYRNSLGWQWSAQYLLVGAMIGVGVSVSTGVGDEQDEQKRAEQHAEDIVKDPNPWWWPFGGGNPFKRPRIPRPTFNKPKVKPGLTPGPLKISLDGTGSTTSPQLWGPDDVKGLCRYAEAGGITFESPIVQGSAKLDALLEFTEGWSATPLSFILTATPTWGAKPKATGKLTFSLKGPAVGAGNAVLWGDATFDTPPEPKPGIVDDRRVWHWQAGPFATGSDDASGLTGKLAPLVNQVVVELDVGSQVQALREAGIDPQRNFTLHIEVIGYASRRWTAAGSERERLEENEQLAIRRARAVAGRLEEQFGRYDTVIVAGGGDLGGHFGGPAAVIPVEVLDSEGRPTGTFREATVQDAQAEAYFRSRKAELDGQLSRKEITKDAYDSDLEGLIAKFSRQSNSERARKVDIQVTWEGKRVALGEPGLP